MSKLVTVEMKEDIVWDDWGRFVRVFSKGQRTVGRAHHNNDGKLQSVSVSVQGPRGEIYSDSISADQLKVIY